MLDYNIKAEIQENIENKVLYLFHVGLKKLRDYYKENLNELNVIAVSFINEFSFILSSDNRLFCIGRNITFGKMLKKDNANLILSEITNDFNLKNNEKLIKIHACKDSIIVLGSLGTVFFLGEKIFHDLYKIIGNNLKRFIYPPVILNGLLNLSLIDTVIDIYSNSNFFTIQTRIGKFHAFGDLDDLNISSNLKLREQISNSYGSHQEYLEEKLKHSGGMRENIDYRFFEFDIEDNGFFKGETLMVASTRLNLIALLSNGKFYFIGNYEDRNINQNFHSKGFNKYNLSSYLMKNERIINLIQIGEAYFIETSEGYYSLKIDPYREFKLEYINFIKYKNGERIYKCSSTYILLNNGRIFRRGENFNGELGTKNFFSIDDKNFDYLEFSKNEITENFKLELNEKIVNIFELSKSNLFVSNFGKIFITGLIFNGFANNPNQFYSKKTLQIKNFIENFEIVEVIEKSSIFLFFNGKIESLIFIDLEIYLRNNWFHIKNFLDEIQELVYISYPKEISKTLSLDIGEEIKSVIFSKDKLYPTHFLTSHFHEIVLSSIENKFEFYTSHVLMTMSNPIKLIFIVNTNLFDPNYMKGFYKLYITTDDKLYIYINDTKIQQYIKKRHRDFNDLLAFDITKYFLIGGAESIKEVRCYEKLIILITIFGRIIFFPLVEDITFIDGLFIPYKLNKKETLKRISKFTLEMNEFISCNDSKVISIAFNGVLPLFLTDKGRIFVLTANTNTMDLVISYLLVDKKINSINWAENYYLAISDKGSAIQFHYWPTSIGGINQNSFYDFETINDQINLKNEDKIIKINSLFLLTESGRLFQLRRNDEYGLLMIKKIREDKFPIEITIFIPMEKDDQIIDFFNDETSTLVVTQNQKIFVWGNNEDTKLGVNKKINSKVLFIR